MSSKPVPYLFEGKTLSICLHDVSHMVRIPAGKMGINQPHEEYLRVHIRGAGLASPMVKVEGDEIDDLLSAWRNYHRWIERSTGQIIISMEAQKSLHRIDSI